MLQATQHLGASRSSKFGAHQVAHVPRYASGWGRLRANNDRAGIQVATSPVSPVIKAAAPPTAAASATARFQDATSTAPHPPPLRELHDPAHIGASTTVTCTVADRGGGISLDAYMRLPVEQYFVLDPSQIRFISGNRFMLAVPRINILNVWLEPLVEVEVRQESDPPRLVLEAENCRIRGSDLIQNLKLDERFRLRFVTELTWQTTPRPAAAARSSSNGSSSSGSMGSSSESLTSHGSTDGPPIRMLPLGGGAGAPAVSTTSGRIDGTAQLDVWSEVIPPFNLMPRSALEASCNAVMRALVDNLLPLFVRRLGADYERWAADPAYRAQRASRSKPLS